MLNLIKEIIAHAGPRKSGTDAETKAQKFIAEKLRIYTDNVEFLPFDEYLDARFGKIRWYVVFFFIAMALYRWLPMAAALLACANALVLLLDMGMYRDILTTIPGKKGTSSNTTAVLEPQGEVKSTLIFSAHMDSTPEFTWWYRFGHFGVVLTVVAMLLMLVQAIFFTVHAFNNGAYDIYGWWALLAISPLTIVMWTMLGEEVVQGAQDNLSGIAISYEIFKTLADPNQRGKSVLKNTRIRFLSFGSEEKGLMGSRYYAQSRKEELHKENAHLINIDNVRQASQLTIIGRELLSGIVHSPLIIKKLQESFDANSIKYKMGMAPIGGSDAQSFAKVGIPSITVIGMDSDKHDFTYHTRHDVPENIEPEALEHLKVVMLDFAKKWDAK